MDNTVVRDKDGNLIVGLGDEITWMSESGEQFTGVIIDMNDNVAEVLIESARTIKVKL